MIGRISTGEWYSVQLSSGGTSYREAGRWSPLDGRRDVLYVSNATASPFNVYSVEDLSTYLGRTTMVEIRGHRSGTVVTVEVFFLDFPAFFSATDAAGKRWDWIAYMNVEVA